MKTSRSILRLALTLIALLALTLPDAQAQKKDVAAVKTWKGSVENDAAQNGAPKFLAAKEDLEKLWKDWKIADQPPEVDFTKEIVVVQTTKGSILNPSFQLDEKGNLQSVGMATMDYLPGFRYVLSTVPRAGVKSVDGKELPAAK